MVKCAIALLVFLFFDLLSTRTLLIETESGEKNESTGSSEEENGSGWMKNSWQNDWNGNDYNDCKNLRECLLSMKEKNTRRPRIDPIGNGK